MSLESASFIKALVASNPEGTDPKSQGDDHLRMIKAVLQSQFSGLTQGKSIRLTEDMINQLGGDAGQSGITNVDTVNPYSMIFGIVPGFAGSIPPGTVPGDVVFHLAYNSAVMFQMLFQENTGYIFNRCRAGGAWSAWFSMTPLGVSQAWTQPARAFNTNYTNTTGRSIQVNITAAAQSAACNLTLYSSGVPVAQATSPNSLTAVNVSAIVPNGGTYNAVTSANMNLAIWAELR